MSLSRWSNAPIKYSITVPAHAQEYWRIAIADSTGTTPTDNTDIIGEVGDNWSKIAFEIGSTGVEATAEVDASGWDAGTGSTGTPASTFDLGSSDDGYAGLTEYGDPQDNVAGDALVVDGNDGLTLGDYLGDSSDSVFRILIKIGDKSAGAQVFAKDGGATNGIAAGIDATGNLGIFGRSGGTLSKITIPATAYANDTWYLIYFTKNRVTILDAVTLNIVATATGTCNATSGTAYFSVFYATWESPITGSTSYNVEFCASGTEIGIVEVFAVADLVAPSPATGDIYLPPALLSAADPVKLTLYADGSAVDNPNITDVVTPPTSYWDAADLVTWGKYVTIYMAHDQIWATQLALFTEMSIAIATRQYLQVTQIMATAQRRNLSQDQVFDTNTPLYLAQDQMFDNLAQVALLTTQVMRNYGAPVALEMMQTWAAYDYDLIYLPMVQMIGASLDAMLQEIQFSVTVAASPVGIVDCDFDRKGFCNNLTLLLRERSEWINKQVGDPVVLTLFGEQYQLIVVNKPQDEQIAQGSYEVGYLLECSSITCQLAEGLNPDISASRVTATFIAGTMLTSILDFLTDGVCSYNLDVFDFPVGDYEFDDSERYAALREVLPEQYGWIIQTDQQGVLQLSQWSRPDIGGDGQKTLTMSRKSLTPPADTLYTQVDIKNYNQDDTSGLSLEVVDNGDGTGTIYVYSVPWTDAFDLFDSEDSFSPSLLITGGDVEEVEIEDTDVEFVDYAASLSKPCYSSPVIDWGNNDSLSPVTYTESGDLTTTADPGYSVAVTVTYTTFRKAWAFDNRKIDVTQVRPKYV